MLALIDKGNPREAHPPYWAPFVESSSWIHGGRGRGATNETDIHSAPTYLFYRTEISAAQHRHADASDTLPCHTDLTGRCPGEVNDATNDVGPHDR